METEPGEVVFFAGHPSWLSMTGLYGRGLLLALLAGVVAGIVTALTAGHVQGGWVVGAVALAILVLLVAGQIKRLQTTYAITSRRLTIETGIFARRLRQTRIERIQDVDTSQSLAERLLRIGTVAFDTASETDYDFRFAGVADPRGIVRTVDQALEELHSGLRDP